MFVDPGRRVAVAACHPDGRRWGMSRGEWNALSDGSAAAQQRQAWAVSAVAYPGGPTIAAVQNRLASPRSPRLWCVRDACRSALAWFPVLAAHHGGKRARTRALKVRARRRR